MKRLVIGVDFGTTYSGVAYSHLGDETREPLIITDWGAGPESEKVPTVIRYNVTNHLGGAFGYKWGYEVLHHERRQEWFKLGLDPMTYTGQGCVDLSQTYASELAEPPDYSRDITTLVSDYLTALRKQTMKSLNQMFGPEALRQARIDWVITTPAVWSLRAKDDTLRCAEKAGMGNGNHITIVSEPEAAAVYVTQMLENVALQVGDSIVVCDAGGGTVDLITYRILSLSPFEVEESAIPNGGKCGGVFVDRIFEKMVNDRLGPKSGLTDLGKQQLMSHFESYVKRQYSGEPLEEFYLPAPGAKNNSMARVAGSNMQVTSEDLKKTFDPVIQEVLTLVKHQIDDVKGKVSAVLLVGGFGQSRYLRKRLETEISPVQLLCPPNGWSAIARGAVLKGIAARSSAPSWRVSTRKAVCHFGIEVRKDFIEGTHDPRKKVWDALEGKYKCGDLMLWFVNRDQDLSETKCMTFKFYRNIIVGKSLKVTEELQYSFDPSLDGPFYYDVESCRAHSQLKVDLTPQKEKFPKRIGANGKEYYHVSYEILATFRSADIEYKWRYNGQVFDQVKARYCQ